MSYRKMAALTVFMLGIGVAVPASRADVICVDDDAAPGGDGTCWTSPYKYLQDALAAAEASGQTITEIRVAGSIYIPDRNASNPDGTGNRSATFRLVSGVALRGGYAGLTDRGNENGRDYSQW